MRLLATFIVLAVLACPAAAQGSIGSEAAYKHEAARPSLIFLGSRLRLPRSILWHYRPVAGPDLLSPRAEMTSFDRSPFVRLARLFIEDVPVARFGNLQVRLKIILE